MSKSPQIQLRINTIAKEMANGKDRDAIMAIYVKKWQTSKRTIDRLIEKAKPIAKSLSSKADKAAEDTMIAEIKEAVKSGLKSVIEIDMKVQEIIFAKKNSTADQLRAVDLFYKRHGHFAPTRSALTDTDGKDIPVTKELPTLSTKEILIHLEQRNLQ